jgi:hypothetical protein
MPACPGITKVPAAPRRRRPPRADAVRSPATGIADRPRRGNPLRSSARDNLVWRPPRRPSTNQQRAGASTPTTIADITPARHGSRRGKFRGAPVAARRSTARRSVPLIAPRALPTTCVRRCCCSITVMAGRRPRPATIRSAAFRFVASSCWPRIPRCNGLVPGPRSSGHRCCSHALFSAAVPGDCRPWHAVRSAWPSRSSSGKPPLGVFAACRRAPTCCSGLMGPFRFPPAAPWQRRRAFRLLLVEPSTHRSGAGNASRARSAGRMFSVSRMEAGPALLFLGRARTAA